MVEKFPQLRNFEDTQGNMNQSLLDSHRELPLVSPFTLLAKTTKRRRLRLEDTAFPVEARSLYQLQLEEFYALGLAVPGGHFRTTMSVGLENEGPVTLSLESRAKEKREKG